MNWTDIFIVRFSNGTLQVQAGIPLLIVALTVIAVAGLASLRRNRGWKLTKANFRFAGLGQIELCPDNDVAQIAHTAWAELRSRKAALGFDPEQDVVVEMYNSWYDLFKALRDLAKSVPPTSMRAGDSAPVLAEILLAALNEGLRPHLTCWQAKFRRWYGQQLDDPANKDLTPQQIQRRYPEYDALVSDLVAVCDGLNTFTEELRKIAHDREKALRPGWFIRSRSERRGIEA